VVNDGRSQDTGLIRSECPFYSGMYQPFRNFFEGDESGVP
jgi:hypothetical protein